MQSVLYRKGEHMQRAQLAAQRLILEARESHFASKCSFKTKTVSCSAGFRYGPVPPTVTVEGHWLLCPFALTWLFWLRPFMIFISCQFSHCVTKNNLVYLICKRVRFLWLLQNTGGKQLERLLLTHLFRGFNPQLLGSAVFRPMAKGNAMPGSCLLHGG